MPCQSATKTLHTLQERVERRQKFLDSDIKPMTIDDAMSALLDVSGEQFRKNVELYGAVHTDELRYIVLTLTNSQLVLWLLIHAHDLLPADCWASSWSTPMLHVTSYSLHE